MRFLLAVTGALAGMGCYLAFDDSSDPPPDLPPVSPLGDDVSLDGQWVIDGAPADASSCASAGIATVALTFPDGTGGRRVFEELTFLCASGGFDTRPDAVLSAARHRVQWIAFDTFGRERIAGPTIDLVAVAPITHATLEALSIESGAAFTPRGMDAELTGDWTIEGAAPDATSCARLGIADVALVFYDAGDTGLARGVAVGLTACEAGFFDSMPFRVLRHGSYLTTYRALDAGGGLVAESEPTPLALVPPITRVMLAPVDFVGSGTTGLEVLLAWDTDPRPSVMADADCATAGVARMSYALRTESLAIVDAGEDVACVPGLTWPGLAPGIYSLYLDGDDATGGRRWMGTCEMLTTDGGLDSYNCFVDQL